MIVLDFETYSPYDIDFGLMKYLSSPNVDIVCMAYKIDDSPTQLWVPGYKLPDFTGHTIYAHNSSFDYLVWHKVGVPKYQFQEIPLASWEDTMALATRYSYPGELAKVSAILELPKVKTAQLALLKSICTPTAWGARPQVNRDFKQSQLDDFHDYCMNDVNTTYYLIKALPSNTLSASERAIWDLTFRMNMRGLPIDTETVEAILDQVDIYTDEMMKLAPEITDGAVQKVTQIDKVIKYLQSTGLAIQDLTAETVKKYLATDTLTSTQRSLLELRQILGSSSIKKYKRILHSTVDGFIHFNVQYYAAGTGRWAARGFQMHNLPRAKVNDPEEYITKFRNRELVDEPIKVAKALIRPMICAPEGKSLICSDYGSIEYVLLLHEAEEFDELKLFAKGLCQYTSMAAFLFNKPYDQVLPNERQLGKVIILGCGYGMGVIRFIETCAAWGIIIEYDLAYRAVYAYRAKYSKVPKLWYGLKDAAVSAIRNPGQAYKYKNTTFIYLKDRTGHRYLLMSLGSGRAIYYSAPFLDDDKYGVMVRHYGVHPYSKKWCALNITPGRFAENLIQGLARDVMAHGLLNVEKNMPEISVLGTVHDEGIGMINNSDIKEDTLKRYNDNLCALPSWACLNQLPLRAEGWIGKRYRKA